LGGGRGFGFVLSLGFQNGKLLERPVEGTVEVALVTGEQGEALTAVGECLKDPREAILAGHFGEFVVDIFGAARQLIGEQAGFDGPDAAEAPAGDGHGLDQIRLDRIGGLELLDVGVEEELELFMGFGGKHDGLGGEAVAKAVAGRLGSAFRGGGAAGLGAVGAGGFNFAVGGHDGFDNSLRAERVADEGR
jgi:hypothetical protein